MAKKKKGKGKKKQAVRVGKQRAVVVQVQSKKAPKKKASGNNLNRFMLHASAQRGHVMRGVYTEKGNQISVIELGNIIPMVPIDGVGTAQTLIKINDSLHLNGINFLGSVAISPSLFDHFTKFVPPLTTGVVDSWSGLYDRHRVRRMRFMYQPAASTARDGQIVMWIDYGGVLMVESSGESAGYKDRTTASEALEIVKSIGRQQHCVRGPLHKPMVLEWNSQQPDDKNWSRLATSFGSQDAATKWKYCLNIAILMADSTSTDYAGTVYADVIVDCTGSQ
jgi:hypothetical protein